MHEYPITLEILESAKRHALAHGAERVVGIKLVMGDHCGYLADAIELYFDIIAEGGPCAGARLEIERIKPLLRCRACGKLFPRRPFEFSCPEAGCGGEGIPTEIGREFYIRSIEIDKAET